MSFRNFLNNIGFREKIAVYERYPENLKEPIYNMVVYDKFGGRILEAHLLDMFEFTDILERMRVRYPHAICEYITSGRLSQQTVVK